MGGSETDKPAKESKGTPTSTTQEQSSVTGNVNPEWPGFQGYSAIPPPPEFIASTPQAYPYMWGVQHIMPPYGTPPHPYIVYPHGVYAHPSIPLGSYPFSPFAMPSTNGMTEASGNTPGSTDPDGRVPEGKEKLPIKRSRGSLGSLNMITGKTNDQVKVGVPLADGACSKSGESVTEGSSEGSDAHSQNDSPIKSAAPAGVVAGPTTNLNIGMDYWGSASSAMRGKVSSSPVAPGVVTAGSRDNIQSQLWLQNERELKRQKRKQSNRESARRSRLRKQTECDELAQRAESLKEENANLRAELACIRNEHEQLIAENRALKERLGEAPEDSETGKTEHQSFNDQSSEETE